jgi:hypothetical protein
VRLAAFAPRSAKGCPIAALREKVRISQMPYLRAFASIRFERFVDLAKHRVRLFEHGLVWEAEDSIASLA